MHWRPLRPTCCFALLLTLAGCGGKAGVEVHPTSGTVTIGGQSAANAEVTLYAVDEAMRGPGKPIPTGRTDASGRFQLTSFKPDDGAPAGEYNVAVLWIEAKPSGTAEPATQIDKLKGKYSDPATSGLKATVPAGGGELEPLAL